MKNSPKNYRQVETSLCLSVKHNKSCVYLDDNWQKLVYACLGLNCLELSASRHKVKDVSSQQVESLRET
jgi:hypothetical protein